MSKKQKAGFIELPHTADWAVEVWAAQYDELLVQAARAFYALAEIRLAAAPRCTRRLAEIRGDPESMLVAFLSELIYLSEQQRLGFDCFDLEVGQDVLKGVLEGAAIASQRREIKAVTFHNLAIQKTSEGLTVTIVFDV